MMLRIACFCVALCAALPATAQNVPPLPDATQIRNDPRLDMTWTAPFLMQQAIAASEDSSWFDTFHATSTITQQVAKNYLLSGQRTLVRKTMELRLAIDMANAFSPDEVISIYAQRIYLGKSCYGFEDALTHRIGVDPADAGLSELLTLAALMRAPVIQETNRPALTSRFDYIAQTGVEAGFWSQSDADQAITAGPSPLLDVSPCPTEG